MQKQVYYVVVEEHVLDVKQVSYILEGHVLNVKQVYDVHERACFECKTSLLRIGTACFGCKTEKKTCQFGFFNEFCSNIFVCTRYNQWQ